MFSGICKKIFCFLWTLLAVYPLASDAVSVKSYSYDAYGNTQEITDPRGHHTQYQYDLINRLEKINYPDAKSVRYTYNLSNICIKMEDHRGSTLFEPDEFGRITKVTFPDGQAVSYQYDTENNLIKLVYPDESEIEYTYDLSNRLETVKDASGITRFEYDELSNLLKRKTLPNGITTEYLYHKTRKPSNVIHKSANGNLLEEFRYAYDENGNRTKIEKINTEGSSYAIYSYDKLNRVIKAALSNGFFEEFSYDGAGNRLCKTTPQGKIIYEYDEENRLIKAGKTVYVYDPAGNLIEKSTPTGKATYQYDFENRLIFYSDESNQVVFEYDGNGNRISKTVNGTRTEYINDLIAPVTQVLLKKVQGSWWKSEKTIRYTYGGSRINQSANGNTQFYLYDSLGRNVSSLVGPSGNVLDTYDYDAFGGSLSEEQDIPNVYKYGGEQFDKETGLIFLRNRYYDPETGRFISKDPHPGKLDRPSTLNPYCYVENNPVNFVDPWGFEAIEPKQLELVIVHTNAMPGWFGGQGIGGHAFMEFPARQATAPYFGNYPGKPSTDEAIHKNAKTSSVGAYCNSQKVTNALEVMQSIEWTICKNCVHTVVEGMKIMKFPQAEKIRLSPIPLPSELQSQMFDLHQRDPIRPLSHPREGVQSPIKTSSPLSMSMSPLDFGGVSLSKTAELQLKIAEITGAAFDPVSGQIILFGPQDRYLPEVDPDDLAVAVKSVYGIGNDPHDPGISIDTISDSPGTMSVRYDGATANTGFGQTIFEADYLLKGLVIGKNPATGHPFNLSVPGYSSVINRLSAHQWSGEQLDLLRFWFIPDQISLIESEDHKGMVFSDVRMKVLSEASFKGSLTDHPACREFAEHFTLHYDEFAKQLPVLEKLKNLGKITAIVKWLKENNIPFDTSFFANYQPKNAETPYYVNPIKDTYQWSFKQMERKHVPGHKHKKDVEVTYSNTVHISGGVLYRLTSQNFSTYTHPTAQEFASSALKSRPSENDFSWSFQSPTNRETFHAIAQSIYRTKKPGNVKKSYVDLSFPTPGAQNLSLQRFYNSFSEKDSPFGVGWRMLPYELELPTEKKRATTKDGREFITYPMILVRTPEGEDFYQLYMLSHDDLPLFKSALSSNILQDNLNGTFSLTIPRMGRMDFDNQGRLFKTLDENGITIDYEFHDHDLTAIRHQNGSKIKLEYENSHLVSASGPGNNTIRYAYNDTGQLAAAQDAHKASLLYSYDTDKRLNKITDSSGNTLFEAEYDDYNRAVFVKEGLMSYRSDFSLEKKSTIITNDQGQELTLRFDDKDRLTFKKEPSGLIWEFIYGQDRCPFPTKIIDPKGGITECHFDVSGNLIYLKNPIGAEWRFFFDESGNLIAQREPNGRAIWNLFAGKNNLCQSFFKATLEVDENDPYATGFKRILADGDYAIDFSYNSQSKQLISLTNTRKAETTFTYDTNGRQKSILYPTGYLMERKVDENGKTLQISDGFGIHKSYEYDEYDRPQVIQTAVGSTHFTYDDKGNLRMIIDPKGFTTSYDYDSEHNIRGVTDAERGNTSYEHNRLNQLTHISLPNGTCKTLKYDRLGHLEQEIWGN